MEELFTETVLVHGFAGFTTKSGSQAAVETVADPEGPGSGSGSLLGSGHGCTSMRSTLGHSLQALVDIQESTATSEEFQSVLLEKGVGLCDGWLGIVLERFHNWNHVIIFACHACQSA